jgi:glucosamine-6-phosphate deaminase
VRVIEEKDQSAAASTMAMMIYNHISENPETTIGVATGNTMIPVYADLHLLIKKHPVNLSQIKWFALDEYIGVPSEHPSSFRSYLLRHLMGPLGLLEESLYLPNPDQDYEKTIQEAGGIDLQLLGVGVNGHIGFNEPGSEKNSRTRIVELDSKTLESNKPDLKDLAQIPHEAISIGVGTILDAKKIILLATGKSKREAIHKLLQYEDRSDWPVTYLKRHENFTLITDALALPEEYLKL